MLSLRELRRAGIAIDQIMSGHRVERIVQTAPLTLIITLYGRDADGSDGRKRHLLVSCAPGLGRVSLRAEKTVAPETPLPFARFLRARLPRAVLRGAALRGGDRQLVLHFESREGVFQLLLSLMGNRSNAYLLDAGDRVLAAMRPLEQTRRALAIGGVWQDPPVEQAKEGEDRFESSEDADYLAAIEAAYAPREAQGESDTLSRRIAQSLRKERKLAERRLARIEAELAEASEANELQRRGELLKGALGQVEAGASEVRVRDYATGEEVTIPLDPSKSPKANMDATFKKYQKLVRRLSKAGGQVDRAQERVQDLVECEQLLESLEGEAIEELAERPLVRELLAKHARAVPRQGAAPAPKPKLPGPLRNLESKLVPRRYLSKDGLEIWVGRSDAANDYLTTRLARGKDLFFHLDGAPGSHVILRTEGRADPPQESVLDACELAVRFSKFKNATRADVHVVPIRNVTKPKGAKKGLVYVTGGKSIHLRRDAARSERILASKIE
jgi:predicted ribosome quality control (RQC) complex YloA/Tae2 family protein